MVLAANSGCGGGGGGVSGTPAPPEPAPSSKIIEITGNAGPDLQAGSAAPTAYQINFINDYTINACDINSNPIAGSSGQFTGATSFKVRVPLDDVSKFLMLTVKHKNGGTIYKKIIGKTPPASQLAEESKTIKIENAVISEDSTVKALIALNDRSKLPDTLINAAPNGRTDFENELDLSLNDDDGTAYVNQLKTVFNTIVKVINTSNVRMQSVKSYFLNDLNAFLNSFVEVGQIYQSDETVKQLLSSPPSVTIKGVSINSASRLPDVNSVISSINSSVSAVVKPPVFSPPPGLYKTARSVTISTPTEGAFIRYTTDGSEPSSTSGILYSSPLAISTAHNFKAIAFKALARDSKVSSASYSFDIAVKPSSPLVLNTIGAGASAFTLKNIYDNGQSLSQTAGTLNPYFEIVFRRADSQPFNLDQNPSALKIRLRVTKTFNTVPVVKTYAYAMAPLADETLWDEEFSAPAISADRISFSVKAGQSHFTEDNTYNLQLLALEGVSYTAEGSPKIYFTLPAGVAGTLTVKSGSSTKTATPIISPAGGLHISSRTVAISCPTQGAAIYYTDDGSTPTANSIPYTGAFNVERTLTIKAVAVKSGLEISDQAVAVFTIKTAAPSFDPAGGFYDSARQVVISCATNGARIYYTEDGSQPTEASTLYSAPIGVVSTRTIKAVAVKNGTSISDTSSATYNIAAISRVAQPVFYPVAGAYVGSQSVTITCATPGATIKYTTDSSDPITSATAVAYSSPVAVESTLTLKAAAVKAGNENSSVASGLYTIKAAAPVFNPPAGSYSSAQQVIISTATAGASIYYTTDGTEPSVSSHLYNGPVAVSESLTIRAVAVKTGLAASDVAPAAYTISQLPKVAAVTFNPPAGTYIGAQSVSLICQTPGATIRYTLDGSVPGASTGLVYSAPVQISSAAVIKAVAFKAGMADSDPSSASYTVSQVPKVQNVRFDSAAKTLSWDPVSVPGAASVKYYINGSASAFGQVKQINDDVGTTETTLNVTGMIPPEYASLPLDISVNVTAAAVKPGGGEVRGIKSDDCEFSINK